MSDHQIGDLVMYRKHLGYIKGFEELKNGTIRYKVQWFNEQDEVDVSTEWEYGILSMKATLMRYMHEQAQSR